MSIRILLAVALGSSIGGTLRHAIGEALLTADATGFPWSTLTVNLLGSLVIGWFATLSAPDGRLFVGTATRQFVMTGVCGGFTTFSIFSLETMELLQQGAWNVAIMNVVGTTALCLLAAWAGHVMALRANELQSG